MERKGWGRTGQPGDRERSGGIWSHGTFLAGRLVSPAACAERSKKRSRLDLKITCFSICYWI